MSALCIGSKDELKGIDAVLLHVHTNTTNTHGYNASNILPTVYMTFDW